VVGLAAVASLPAGVGVSWYSERVDLVYAVAGAAAAGGLLGVASILFARHAYWRIQRTVGRSGRARAARVGRALGVLGVCVAITGGLALGFFGLLELFAT
jgi:hypothetical protein